LAEGGVSKPFTCASGHLRVGAQRIGILVVDSPRNSSLAMLTTRTFSRKVQGVPAFCLSTGGCVPTVTVTEARSALYQLLDGVAASHEPVLITGKRGNAVLIAEEDWRAINETLYLLSIPGMRESIIEGMKTPMDECVDEVEW
jgi:prevent-host-death family protein